MEQPVAFGMAIVVIDFLKVIDVQDRYCVTRCGGLEQHPTQATIAAPVSASVTFSRLISLSRRSRDATARRTLSV